ncbi:uncharacterized protein VTP21DRAFT_11266 [Calcarisporiella thermophila]|uniref:uncharacterized protein n=1 Tax=Calcarisporiella thermophila TaxID=911321 RepID=UPI0037441965
MLGLKTLVTVATLFLADLVSCQQPQTQPRPLLDVLKENAETAALATLLSNPQYAQLAGFFNNTGSNNTLIAPSTTALGTAMQADLGKLQASDNTTDMISAFLRYHIVEGGVRTTSLSNGVTIRKTQLKGKPFVNLPNDGAQVVAFIKDELGVSVSYGVDKARIVQSDLETSSGVVQVVDKVLMIPQNVSTTAALAKNEAFVKAITEKNLSSVINTLEGVTVFVPTNEALSKVLNSSSTMNDTVVANLLKYHVIHPQVYYSPDLTNNTNITTVQGGSLTVINQDNKVILRDANNNQVNVVMPNLITSNGVIHVIDGVLTPPPNMINTTIPGTTGARSGASNVAIGSATLGLSAFMTLLVLLL